jgi:hypothetical protein
MATPAGDAATSVALTEPSERQRERALERYKKLRPHLERDAPLAAVAEAASLPLRTAQHWVSRYRRFGLVGLTRAGRADLSDPSFEPFMTMAQVAAGFGVGQSTASAKAKVIANGLGLHRMDPQWTLPSLAASNPLTWMAQDNGLLVDLRTMPREVQQIAFDQGMIPYIPADKEAE